MVEKKERSAVSKLYVYSGIVVIIIGLISFIMVNWYMTQISQDLYEEKITAEESTELLLLLNWFRIAGEVLFVIGFMLLIYGIYHRLRSLESDILELKEKSKTPASTHIETWDTKK
jgi:nitric oxide reductase large subunit